jgi:hypothetical protein
MILLSRELNNLLETCSLDTVAFKYIWRVYLSICIYKTEIIVSLS